jgi:arsenate reductase
VTITIYHNPACGTSRNVLAMIRNSGLEPRVIEYLKTPPTREELAELIRRMGLRPRDLLRRKGAPYEALGLDDPKFSDETLIDLMIEHPILINRPIVVSPLGVKLCRPSETVLEILPNAQQQSLFEEDGTPLDDLKEEKSVNAKVYNVLFLCTGNSARSVIAECLLNREGRGHFRAFSAGSHPTGRLHPYALDLLKNQNYPTAQLRSKSWSEFAGPGALPLDFVFTVCDNAANEVCPVWPGQPMSAHWGVPDPAAVEGSEAVKRAAFADAMRMLTQRISIFVNLPLASLDKLSLQKRLDEIGRAKETASPTAAA